jgi:uncharacterized heparinase superfamily protein
LIDLHKRIVRLYHTVKYLKAKQIFWRLLNLTPRFISEVNEFPPISNEQLTYNFIPCNVITTDYDQFKFLNETHSLKVEGWDDKSISKLWRYNLHYFGYLLQNKNSAYQIEHHLKLIEKWIDDNPFGRGTGWEPYPTSLRIINWIKWHWFCDGLSDRAKLSLWNQVRWLANRPEYHLLGNHLFINAKALLFASAFFRLDSNSKYFKESLSILHKELKEQFLDDGAHFELSPMYHSLAMEDLLDLISISNKVPNNFPSNEIMRKYNKRISWLETMIYNNGELAHFNDCANGIAPKYSDLEDYAVKLGIAKEKSSINNLYIHKESGFVVYKDVKSHLIADFGKIGPDYLPGHAHADTLSFELAINGERIVVNSGTSVYGNSDDRLLQRGTGAHSTIQIDMENSSEVWSGFRVARRAVPFNIQVNSSGESNNEINFQSSHNGYLRLKNKAIHTRKFNLSNDTWSIEDDISGYSNTVVSRFYLHPEIEVRKNAIGIIFSKNHIDLIEFKYDRKLDLQLIDTFYHDQFGVNKANKCIQISGISPCKMEVKFEIL